MALAAGGVWPYRTSAASQGATTHYINVAYTVKPGDTLYGITQRYYMSGNAANIASYNGLTAAQGLKAGASLILPDPLFLGSYTVGQGDTLYGIANRYFTRSGYIQSLMQYNHIADAGKGLRVGMELAIPLPSGSKKHVVLAGETLYGLSVKYFHIQDYTNYIAEYNDLATQGNALKVGQKLQIPNPFYSGSALTTTAQGTVQTSSTTKVSAPATTTKPAAQPPLKIKIDLSENKLYLLQGTTTMKTFSIGSGKTHGLTPKGTFTIMTKVKNPWYVAKDIPGGDPRNPLGTRWLGLSVPHTNGTKYGIHGTNNPSSIGQYVSLGCIRMQTKDVEWLYDKVPTGTVVVIQE